MAEKVEALHRKEKKRFWAEILDIQFQMDGFLLYFQSPDQNKYTIEVPLGIMESQSIMSLYYKMPNKNLALYDFIKDMLQLSSSEIFYIELSDSLGYLTQLADASVKVILISGEQKQIQTIVPLWIGVILSLHFCKPFYVEEQILRRFHKPYVKQEKVL